MGMFNFLKIAAETVSGKTEPSVGVVVATGLILVFGVLVLLYLLITLEGVIFTSVDKKKSKKDSSKKKVESAPVTEKSSAQNEPKIEAGIPGEVVAAIAAAIACMGDGVRYTLRSVKRVKSNGRSAWGQAGVNSYTEPF